MVSWHEHEATVWLNSGTDWRDGIDGALVFDITLVLQDIRACLLWGTIAPSAGTVKFVWYHKATAVVLLEYHT